MSFQITSPKLSHCLTRELNSQEMFKTSGFFRGLPSPMTPDIQPLKKANDFSSNAAKLKNKLNNLQKLSTNEGRKEYIQLQIEENKGKHIKEKASNLKMLQKITGKKNSKIYDQHNVLALLSKKNKRGKLITQNNESKFNAKLEAFRKLSTFIDLKQVIEKMNIKEDDDFKEFLEHHKLTKDPSFTRFQEEETDGFPEKFNREEEENLDFVHKPNHQNLLRKIHQKLAKIKLQQKKNSQSSLSNQLMESLRKEERSLDPNDEFYAKMTNYISNENLLLTQSEHNTLEGSSEPNFTAHKRNVEAMKLHENFKAYKEIQEIRNLLKNLGININNNNQEGEELETSSYSVNYTQKVNDFRRTLKNASLDVLRKNMEEFKENKTHVGIRRNALMMPLSQSNNKYKKLALMRNLSKTETSSNSDIFKSLTSNTSKHKIDAFLTQGSEDNVLKKIIELDVNKKENDKMKKLLEIQKTHKVSIVNSPELRPEVKESFKFRKYDAYLDFVHRNSINNAYMKNNNLVSKETKRNLFKTFDWFVSDVKELEKHYEEEKKKRNERFKTFTEQMEEVQEKLRNETCFLKMNAFEQEEKENDRIEYGKRDYFKKKTLTFKQ